MTQLVFVHGVATRDSASYQRAVANRDRLFRNALFRDPQLKISNPLWGDLVPTVHKDVYETGGDVGTFSIGDVADSSLGGSLGGNMGGSLSGGGVAASSGEMSLAEVAQDHPTVALDAVFIELLENSEAEGSELTDAEIDAFVRIAAAIEADEIAADNLQNASDGAKAMLASVNSDLELAAKVNEASQASGTYGIVDRVKAAVGAVTGRIRKVATSLAFDPLADLVRPSIGFFLGDVFTYLREDQTREKVRGRIRDALVQAHAELENGEKLVVIGHSMGGVILVDMLLADDRGGLPMDLHVDALFTVGSQPGFFQALGLFRSVSQDRIAKPDHIGAWFNVFDPVDPLAFRADPIFSGVSDLKFDSITGIASAHTTYFKRPQFHARARKRLREAGVIG